MLHYIYKANILQIKLPSIIVQKIVTFDRLSFVQYVRSTESRIKLKACAFRPEKAERI